MEFENIKEGMKVRFKKRTTIFTVKDTHSINFYRDNENIMKINIVYLSENDYSIPIPVTVLKDLIPIKNKIRKI